MKGPLNINFEALWQEGMHDWHGQMPVRMVDDALEEAFWAASMSKKKPRQTDHYAEKIVEVIKQHIDSTDTVLEIGPGWGNYTFPLEQYAASVTCVDSSESVLAYLKTHTNNTQFVHAKFEEANLEQHDVVIGVNCFYRMYYMNQTLLKMNRLARKRAIIGMTTGPIQPHYNVLHDKYGYAIKFPRRDYIEILNMLYQLHIFADCQMIPLVREYRYDSKEGLLAAQSKKIIDTSYDLAHVEEALEPFITIEGKEYVYRHTFYAAVISWTPNESVGNK